MDMTRETSMVVLSVAQMQHLNALFAINADADHVVIYEKENEDGNYFETTAKIGFTSIAANGSKKKGKAATRYMEEVVLFTGVE